MEVVDFTTRKGKFGSKLSQAIYNLLKQHASRLWIKSLDSQLAHQACQQLM